MNFPPQIKRVYDDPIALGHALGYKDLNYELHGEMVKFCLANKRCYVEVSRGHLKTSLFSHVMPLWLCLRNRNARVMLISATMDLSRESIGKIADLVLRPMDIPGLPARALWEWFPWMTITNRKARGRFSVEKGIDFLGRAGTGKERSIFPMAAGKAAAGRHPSHIIGDDLQNEQNSNSYKACDKVIYGYTTLTPLLMRLDCPVWLVGTPWSIFDLGNHLIEKLKIPVYRRSCWSGRRPDDWPADAPPPGPVDENNGETGFPLCPDLLSADDIIRLQTPGNEDYIPNEQFFLMQYRLLRTAAASSIFTRQQLELATDHSLATMPDMGYEVVLVDPASAGDADSCHSGVVVYRIVRAEDLGLPDRDEIRGTGWDRNHAMKIIVEAEDVPDGTPALFRALEAICKRPERRRVSLIGIEETLFVHDYVLDLASKLPPWVRLCAIPRKSGQNAEARAMGLANRINAGEVRFQPDFKGRDALWSQMLAYGANPPFDDVLDAAALVVILPGEMEPPRHKAGLPEKGSIASLRLLERRINRSREPWPVG